MQAFPTALTGLVATQVAGESLIVANNSLTGMARIGLLHLPSGTPPVVADDRFTSPPGFMPGVRTHIAPLSPKGQPMIFSYSALDGLGYFYRIGIQGRRLDFAKSIQLGIGGLSLLGLGAPALGGFADETTGTNPSKTFRFWFYNAATDTIRMGEFA